MPNPKRKTVLIAFLGGATIDGRGRRGDVVHRADQIEPWLARMAELDIIADVEGAYISSGLDPIGAGDWTRLGRLIAERYRQVDGIVVIHQTETLSAAATAISLMCGKLGKPIILCGSSLLSPAQKAAGWRSAKLAGGEQGVRSGFVNAVQVAVSDIAEVLVVSGSNLYRGRSVTGVPPQLRGQVIGKIDFGIRFFGSYQRRNPQPLRLKDHFESEVVAVEYLPGTALGRSVVPSSRTKAIFISWPEDIDVARPALDALRSSLPKRLPLIVYAPGRPVPSGALCVDGSSRSSALVRVMWALGQTKRPSQLVHLLRD